jgi:DNA-binding transcriptional MerR regulator
MKPVDVAHKLSIGGSTVRAWSREFAPFLSPTAVGGDNRRRDFSVQDVSILNVIKQMTDRNTPREEIIAALTNCADDWRELPTFSAHRRQRDPPCLGRRRRSRSSGKVCSARSPACRRLPTN